MYTKALDFYTPYLPQLCFSYDNLCCCILCIHKDVLKWVSSISLIYTFWASCICMSISFPRLVKFLAIVSLNKPSASFSLSFSLWDLYNEHFGLLYGVPQALKLSLFFLFFFLFLIEWIPLPAFGLLILSSVCLVCCYTFLLNFFQFNYYILIFSISVEILSLFINSCLDLGEHL